MHSALIEMLSALQAITFFRMARARVWLDPSAARLDGEQAVTAVVSEQPVGTAKGRGEEFAQGFGAARTRAVGQKGARDADRGLGDGLVIAGGVRVGSTARLVVSADDRRHVAFRDEIWVRQDPHRGGKMRGMGPLALG